MDQLLECEFCHNKFSTKSNLTRHVKTHTTPRSFRCDSCEKTFTQKQHLQVHLKQHLYPVIPLYRANEAQLNCTSLAREVAKEPRTVDPVWLNSITAEAAAKKTGGELWHTKLVLTFGKYSGQSFRWLLENDVGWVVWLLAEFTLKGEKNEAIRWQKERLLELVKQFPSVTVHLDRRVKKHKEKREETFDAPVNSHNNPGYVEDAELLALAEDVLASSDIPVSTHLTTIGKIVSCDTEEEAEHLSSEQASRQDDESAEQHTTEAAVTLEGWQKTWEQPSTANYQGIPPQDVRWLKENEEYGLYKPAMTYKSKNGEIVRRKLLKDKMEYIPPPVPTYLRGSVPNMHSFFTAPVFFWRPVGILNVKIRCPNTSCPAPPETFLIRKGFSSSARQVCGLKSYYTLLSERLLCTYCEKVRNANGKVNDMNRDQEPQLQYTWMASSPRILMNLAPAVQHMFPAVLCGKRAIDRSAVTLLNDRINSVSMSKVQRLIQQGHDEWYMDRRGLYQTLLYDAHTLRGSSSQSGILSYLKPSGKYTPPLQQSPLPSARVLRWAHMICEMEKMSMYRSLILSVTGEILSIDGTKQVLKKIYGDGQATMQYLTSILNEWGQFVTTVVVASESEDCYKRLARGLTARFKRAQEPAPKILYADSHCCCDGGTSMLESLFADWVEEGMVIRLDIRHWLHRWDAVVIKQTHAKYGVFMSAMAGALLAYNKADMQLLVSAVRNGNKELYSKHSDEEMVSFLKPHQIKNYVRRVTRGVEVSAVAVEFILEQFKGAAGLDIDGIPLFKDEAAVNSHWATASKHLSCMQDPPGIPLYVSTKIVTLNGVELNKYKCRRGTNALEGLHAHLPRAVPSHRCGIMPFQVYLISFAVQWNSRMESLRVAGGKERRSSCVDPRRLQLLNQQSELLFGKEHLFKPDFTAPMPLPQSYASPDEEELLGVEYALCQSTNFASREYYINQVEEEQSREDEEEEEDHQEDGSGDHKDAEGCDEGISLEDDATEDPIDCLNPEHSVLTSDEQVIEEVSPAQQDVLMGSNKLHLPGFEQVESLAMVLLLLVDDSDRYIIPADIRQTIKTAASQLHEHDKSAVKFVKQYESKWGYTLFGRCLGPATAENIAAQKTKFARLTHAQASQITEDSRLLYLVIKMLKNRPPASHTSSPTKIGLIVKAQYKRIVDRVRDDPILSALNIPLPNINSKSISAFLTREEKKANYRATMIPQVTSHRRVLSTEPLPAAPRLPDTLPLPNRPEVQYAVIPHLTGKRWAEKRRLEVSEPSATFKNIRPKVSSTASHSTAPILLVVPSQPQAPSVSFQQAGPGSGAGFSMTLPPDCVPVKPTMPGKSLKPCAACEIPKCGGLRKRYTPAKDKVANSKQKIFTYCPTTQKSTTPGFDDNYTDYEQFKKVVDLFLTQKNHSGED